MSEDPVVRRGVRVEVETTLPAELDVALYEVGDERFRQMVRSLANLPVLGSDLTIGSASLRAIDGFDVVYVISRNQLTPIVTIVRIWPTPERDKMLDVLKSVNWLAIFRGATGV